MPVKSKTDTTNSTSSIAAEVRGATSRVFQRTCAGAASPLGITLKSGESVQGALVDSTDSQLSVKQSKIGRDIAKADIALVDYIRIKPIPENRNIEFPTEFLAITTLTHQAALSYDRLARGASGHHARYR